MSRLLEIREQLQDTSAELAKLERTLAAYPNSFAVLQMAKSIQRRHSALEEEFLQETHSLGIDVCSYRIFGERESPSLRAFSSVLGNFQTLVSVIYDAICSEMPKERARVTPEIAAKTELQFGYTFAGSVGIVLTVPNEQRLIGDSKLDESIDTIFEMAQTSDRDRVAEYARRLGPGSIRAMYNWVSDHAQSGLGVDIKWQREQKIRSSLIAERPQFEHLQNVIAETGEERIEEITVYGNLLGADVGNKKFRMELENGDILRGSFVDVISLSHTVTLPRRYKAEIKRTEQVRYSTEENIVSYELIKLDPI